MTKKVPGAKRGRPKKSEVEQYKQGNIGNGQRGRPKGMAGRIEEFKARLLSTKGENIIHKIMDTAMEDGHPAQSACMKMCIDRMLPVAMFDPDKKNTGTKPTIQINISGVEDKKTTIEHSDIQDVTDIEEEEEDGEL